MSHMPLVTTPMLGRIDMQFNFATWQNRQIKSIHEETLIIEFYSCKQITKKFQINIMTRSNNMWTNNDNVNKMVYFIIKWTFH